MKPHILSKLPPKMGRLTRVLNQLGKGRAATEYLATKIETERGKEVYALFTDFEINRALERAKRNPEDVPDVSWLRNILD